MYIAPLTILPNTSQKAACGVKKTYDPAIFTSLNTELTSQDNTGVYWSCIR